MTRFGTAMRRIGDYFEALSRIPDYNRIAEQELRSLRMQGGVLAAEPAPSRIDAADRPRLAAATQAIMVGLLLLTVTLVLIGAARLDGSAGQAPVMIPAGAKVQDL